MADRDQQLYGSRTISIAAIVPALLGFSLLVSRFRYAPYLVQYGGTWVPPVFFVVGSTMLLFGLWTLFRGGLTKKTAVVNRPVHGMTLPGPGGVYLVVMIVLFIGSLLGRSNMLMLVFSLLAGPFILNGWFSFAMLKGSNVVRDLPLRAMVGEVVSIRLTLSNSRFVIASWLMGVRDWVRPPGETLQTGVIFARVPPRDEREAHYQLCPMKRGRYKFGPLEIFTRFPFGLVERFLKLPGEESFLVHPRIGRLTAAWKRKQQQNADLIDQSQHSRGAYDDEFHRLREYRVGDNPRAIHWRSSARQRELMVREYEQSRDRPLSVLLDLHLPDEWTSEDAERIELAISFAATIAVEQIRANRASELQFAAVGKRVYHWSDNPSGPSIESLLDMLALIKPGSGEDIPAAFERLRSESARSARVVIVSNRQTLPDLETPTPADDEGLTKTAVRRESPQHIYADWSVLGRYFALD